jgi:HD-GYP domain-containing protein (c-di-GMP phosphodiesterase class II)
MSQALKFLTAFSHAFATMNLYAPHHPAREGAITDVLEQLRALVQETPSPVFCFLNSEVVYRDQPLKEAKSWPFGKRLTESKIQRLEFAPGVSLEELQNLIDEVQLRLGAENGGGRKAIWKTEHIKFGPISLPDDLKSGLAEAIDTVESLHEEAYNEGRVSGSLARGVVHTLSQAMRHSGRLLVPLVPLKQADQYTTIHSINSSILSMGLAEFLHFSSGDVRRIGEAALLHDVGKTFIPSEILGKPSGLNPKEWAIIKRHPVDGARLLLRSGKRLELAASVAYEHHMAWNGHGGYPGFRYRRRLHPASRLIQLCDVYDACRTRRPFRDPLSSAEIVDLLQNGAGDQFDPQLTEAIIRMMSVWESRMTDVDAE